jgi:hypothetical protein
MDRRHVVLGAALAASIASQPKDWPPIFSGYQSLDADPFILDGASPTRAWRITVEAALPAEAEDHDFVSRTDLEVGPTEGEPGDLATVSFGECGAEPIETLWPDGLSLDGAFEDCVPRQTCTRTFCLEITTKEDHPVEGAWWTWTAIQSVDTVKHEDSIGVHIEITIEEIEP